MNEREAIREKIRADAINLQTLVVNTACEYKEELMKLEKDILKVGKRNKKVKRKNKQLKKIQKQLEEQNNFLMEELEASQKRIRKFLKKFNKKNLCYNCDHFFDCGDTYLCVYCQKWVCFCCTNKCEEDNCITQICNSCFKTRSICPRTDDSEISKELMCYYKTNFFKKP